MLYTCIIIVFLYTLLLYIVVYWSRSGGTSVGSVDRELYQTTYWSPVATRRFAHHLLSWRPGLLSQDSLLRNPCCWSDSMGRSRCCTWLCTVCSITLLQTIVSDGRRIAILGWHLPSSNHQELDPEILRLWRSDTEHELLLILRLWEIWKVCYLDLMLYEDLEAVSSHSLYDG